MPNRKQVLSGLYYIKLRVPNVDVFMTHNEYWAFIDELNSVLRDTSYQLCAFCLLPGQAHLAVRLGRATLQDFVQRLVMRFNDRMRRERQGPYLSFGPLCEPQWAEDEEGFRRIITNIHSLSRTLDIDPAEYAWSGHRTYLRRAKMPCLAISSGLTAFGSTFIERGERYRDVMAQLQFAHPSTKTHGAKWGANTIPQTVRRDLRIDTMDDLFRQAMALSGRTDDIRLNLFDRDSSELLSAMAWHAMGLHMATLKEAARYLQRSMPTIHRGIKQNKNKDRCSALFKKPGDLAGFIIFGKKHPPKIGPVESLQKHRKPRNPEAPMEGDHPG